MLHSRYIEPDDSPTLLEHHARALANKFLPCTASMFATAVGFGALAISDIRPVRQMGLWTRADSSWRGSDALPCFRRCSRCCKTPLRSEQVPVGQMVSRIRRQAGPGDPPLPVADGGRCAHPDAVRGGRAVRFPERVRAARARDGRVDLRQSERARGAGHAPFSRSRMRSTSVSSGCRRRPATHWTRSFCALWNC
jgi:hypothetical protein